MYLITYKYSWGFFPPENLKVEHNFAFQNQVFFLRRSVFLAKSLPDSSRQILLNYRMVEVPSSGFSPDVLLDFSLGFG